MKSREMDYSGWDAGLDCCSAYMLSTNSMAGLMWGLAWSKGGTGWGYLDRASALPCLAAD